jgi:trimethylamine--corrinoid protein Co-methyltransferase
MRSAALLPRIADRDPRDKWVAKGARDSETRAMQRVHDILARDNPAVFAPDIDQRIRTKFVDLVSGDAG